MRTYLLVGLSIFSAATASASGRKYSEKNLTYREAQTLKTVISLYPRIRKITERFVSRQNKVTQRMNTALAPLRAAAAAAGLGVKLETKTSGGSIKIDGVPVKIEPKGTANFERISFPVGRNLIAHADITPQDGASIRIEKTGGKFVSELKVFVGDLNGKPDHTEITLASSSSRGMRKTVVLATAEVGSSSYSKLPDQADVGTAARPFPRALELLPPKLRNQTGRFVRGLKALWETERAE